MDLIAIQGLVRGHDTEFIKTGAVRACGVTTFDMLTRRLYAEKKNTVMRRD